MYMSKRCYSKKQDLSQRFIILSIRILTLASWMFHSNPTDESTEFS